jgi:hypothetical protein
MSRISQVKHHTGMWLGSPAIGDPSPGELLLKIDAAIEVQAAIRVDVNVQGSEISWRVDESDIASLHEIVGDDDVLLVRGDLDVVGSDGRLDRVWIVETDDVVQVRDVESGDVIGGCQGEVGEAAILGDVGAGRWLVEY